MRQRAPRVLVVTRNANTAELVCGELRRAGCMPALADDGRSALRSAAQQPPALVVSDLVLEDMEGATLLQALRELPGLAEIPAIGIDGPRPSGERPHGFADTLGAPVDPARLIAASQALLLSAPADPATRRPRVLLVQADEERRQMALLCLRHAGYEVTATTGAREAVDIAQRLTPDAVVSDVRLPGVDGFQLAFELRRDRRTRAVPIILTCSPLEPVDLDLVGVVGASAVVVHTPDLGDLVDAVRSRLGSPLTPARSAHHAAVSPWQRLTVERLARAAEFRDEETANHTARVSRYSELLARLSGMDPQRSELIAAASAMHDIGKLGIPDCILRKPGALTATERIHMQRHAEYGHRILAGEADLLLDLAALIALTHHERWDGAGYPRGIGGREIPAAGRIVSIGDVFDALTSDRVYRPALSVDDALREMEAGRGTQFDPHLLDLFVAALPRVLEIRRRHPDSAPAGLSAVA